MVPSGERPCFSPPRFLHLLFGFLLPSRHPFLRPNTPEPAPPFLLTPFPSLSPIHPVPVPTAPQTVSDTVSRSFSPTPSQVSIFPRDGKYGGVPSILHLCPVSLVLCLLYPWSPVPRPSPVSPSVSIFLHPHRPYFLSAPPGPYLPVPSPESPFLPGSSVSPSGLTSFCTCPCLPTLEPLFSGAHLPIFLLHLPTPHLHGAWRTQSPHPCSIFWLHLSGSHFSKSRSSSDHSCLPPPPGPSLPLGSQWASQEGTTQGDWVGQSGL